MKFSIKSNVEHGILIYWVDPKGTVGKRDINKASKTWFFVTSATGEGHADELMALLTK